MTERCPNCGESGVHERDEWGICLADEPVEDEPMDMSGSTRGVDR